VRIKFFIFDSLIITYLAVVKNIFVIFFFCFLICFLFVLKQFAKKFWSMATGTHAQAGAKAGEAFKIG
jgi:hypothetical protein